MATQNHFDYFIVGQGLAGSALAFELLQRGKRIMVWDRPEQNQASAVAAGLFNPITGKVMVKTWKADLLFPALADFYKNAEQVLGRRFFHPMAIYRPFLSAEEQNEWMGRSIDAAWKNYVDKVFTQSEFGDQVNDKFGGLMLLRCGYVEVNVFMTAMQQRLISLQAFQHEFLHEDELTILDDEIRYRQITAKKIIFCNGIHAMHNKLFGNLPLKPLKGETLTIKTAQRLKHIYNRGVYVVPTENDMIYRTGATYSTKDVSQKTTPEGRLELDQKLSDLLTLPFEVTNQQWGIRPTSADRRPFLGAHPTLKNVVIFNGLGTKGVSLAPYFARQLAEWLETGSPIDREADIQRFS